MASASRGKSDPSKPRSLDFPKDITDKFCSITGADEEVARRLLEACSGNLEMAIGMHMDGMGADGGRERGSSVPSGPEGPDCQVVDYQGDSAEVRAPIPQRQEVLVQQTHNFGNINVFGRRRTPRSVFDGLRDFQAEARQLQMGMSEEPKSKKQKTLEDLFRPPIDLMFKGSFHTARDAGTASNRWLMVNIQNAKEFQCQILNRDVWSNPAVKALIREHFVFWQVYNDSEEGRKYMQFYKVQHWPYIAVLDPRTGENLVMWHNVDAISLCDLLTEYLSEHRQPDGGSEPLAKRRRTDSMVDASEDSQLEAAIKASLKETCTSDPIVIDSDQEDDRSGSDAELETFTDSEDDQSDAQPVGKSSRKEETKSEQASVVCSEEANGFSQSASEHSLTHPSSSNEGSSSGCNAVPSTSVSGASVLDCDEPQWTEPQNSSNFSCSRSFSATKSNYSPKRHTAQNGTSLETSDHHLPTDFSSSKTGGRQSKTDTSKQAKDSGGASVHSDSGGGLGEGGSTETVEAPKFQFVQQSVMNSLSTSWRDFLGKSEDPQSVINIRFPNGNRQQFKVPCSTKLKALVMFVQEEGYHKEMYELVTNFPKRRLSYLDVEETLKNHGLFPQETVFVQER